MADILDEKTSTDLGIIEEVHHQIDDSGTSKRISNNSRFLKIKTRRDIQVLKSKQQVSELQSMFSQRNANNFKIFLFSHALFKSVYPWAPSSILFGI